jgi:hypothetical protein
MRKPRGTRRRASGTLIGAGLGIIAVVFGVTLWWFQTQAYYERVEGLATVDFQGRALPVSDYRGIDAASSPLKLRACFRHDWTLNVAPVAKPTPLVAPAWFHCFNAVEIGADLESGLAKAYYAGQDTPEGFDRIIALYPDGRAFMWRQLNEKFAD